MYDPMEFQISSIGASQTKKITHLDYQKPYPLLFANSVLPGVSTRHAPCQAFLTASAVPATFTLKKCSTKKRILPPKQHLRLCVLFIVAGWVPLERGGQVKFCQKNNYLYEMVLFQKN